MYVQYHNASYNIHTMYNIQYSTDTEAKIYNDNGRNKKKIIEHILSSNITLSTKWRDETRRLKIKNNTGKKSAKYTIKG